MPDTAKVIELVGTSTDSWGDAASTALGDANTTLENITGIEVVSQTATVENGTIREYKTTIHLSFGLTDR